MTQYDFHMFDETSEEYLDGFVGYIVEWYIDGGDEPRAHVIGWRAIQL